MIFEIDVNVFRWIYFCIGMGVFNEEVCVVNLWMLVDFRLIEFFDLFLFSVL